MRIMQEEIKILKKQLREVKAKCKDLESENLRLSKEIEILRKEKGSISDPNEMSEEMLKSEIIKHMYAFQKFPAERRRVEEQKRREILEILTPMLAKATGLEKEGNIPEAIKAYEDCLAFGREHNDVLHSSDHEKSIKRIAILYRKEGLPDKEVAFIKNILKTHKKHKQSLYSQDLYAELAYRLEGAEKLLAKKKNNPS